MPLFTGGLPPLMLISIALFPFPLLVPVPPAGPPAFPAAPETSLGEPPGTPGCLPSGEMESRAARFPCGGTKGAGGPGVAESAMNVAGSSFAPLVSAVPSSGAGLASPVCARPTRGAAPAFNSSFGRAGALGETGMAISAGFWSNADTSGRGATVTIAPRRRPRGFNLASVCSLICNLGRAGPGNCWNCTMSGRLGRIFGGSIGAAELTSVCRGCVG